VGELPVSGDEEPRLAEAAVPRRLGVVGGRRTDMRKPVVAAKLPLEPL